MYVIAQSGCSSGLYVELNVLGGAGNVIGITNDVTGRLAAGQQAKLTFDIVEDDAASVRSTEFSCY